MREMGIEYGRGDTGTGNEAGIDMELGRRGEELGMGLESGVPNCD